MAIIDSQVRVYEANTPKRPWHNVPNWPDHVTGDEMVAAMDKVGVDDSRSSSAFSVPIRRQLCGGVQRAHPGRFALVKPVIGRSAVADIIADWKRPQARSASASMTPEAKRDPSDPGLDRIARSREHSRSDAVLGQRGCRRARSTATPIRASLSTIWPSCGPACRLPRRAVGRPPKVLDLTKRKNAVIKVSAPALLSRNLSLPRHFGTRWLGCSMPGVSTMPVGHGLDSRLRGRQLRAGRRAFVKTDRLSDSERAMLIGGACIRPTAVAEERLVSSNSRCCSPAASTNGGCPARSACEAQQISADDDRVRLRNDAWNTRSSSESTS